MTIPKISMVAHAMATDCRETDAQTAVAAIRKGKWEKPVSAIRSKYALAITKGLKPKQAVSSLKRQLPAILWSGSFSQRNADSLVTHSGLLVADLDDVPPAATKTTREALCADPHVYALFASPTGSGLKVVFRVPPDQQCHSKSFEAVAQRVLDLTGLTIDESGKDLARICFVSHDSDAYSNWDAVELPVSSSESPEGPQSSPSTAPGSLDRRNSVATQILGEIEWSNTTTGFCRCPGIEQHTQENGHRDCRVNLDGAPTIHCVHNSCRSAVDQANRRLRSEVGKVEHVSPPRATISASGVESAGSSLPEPSNRPWPSPIHPAALTGLVGEFVETVDPHTEADHNAVLLLFLAAVGCMIGPGPHFVAQASAHPARLWPVLVGDTAGGRKGSAWSTVRQVLRQVDPNWMESGIASGLSSGEGLIWAVRDPISKEKRDKSGSVEVVTEDAGIVDKRLLVVEEEFSAVLKAAARDGNILSDTLRKAWDSGNLRSLTKNSPARASGAHITVTSHVTKAELIRYLGETDALNGFGNRFLWLAVRRSRKLPFGGELHRADLTRLVHRIRGAIDHGRRTSEVRFAPEARPLWEAAYSALAIERPGLLGALTQRAEAQVVRLALTYALLDESAAIGVAHLRSAMAVWDYCQRSAAYIFGDSFGDPVADRLLDELKATGSAGLSGTSIRDLFQRNVSATRISNALETLRQQGRARVTKGECGDKGGRPPTRWFFEADGQSTNATGLGGLLRSGDTTETTQPHSAPVLSFSSSFPSVLPPDPLPPAAPLLLPTGIPQSPTINAAPDCWADGSPLPAQTDEWAPETEDQPAAQFSPMDIGR